MLLGVNIDHVATVRQARRERFPDPVEAAKAAILAGATGITAHLREDRRHIQDEDIHRLKAELDVPLNLEMAVSDDILSVAEKVRPSWACLVPEKRQELTTEGGLDVLGQADRLEKVIARLKRGGTRVSLFVDASEPVVEMSRKIGADAVEIHTGSYARKFPAVSGELETIARVAKKAAAIGLLVNAGHGIDYENLSPLVRAYRFNELNIGFSIVSRAIMVGIGQAVREMKEKMNTLCAES